MQIKFLEAKVPTPRSLGDYKEYVFTFDTQCIHPIDQLYLHKNSSEMMYSTLTNTTMSASNLQVSLNNVQYQIKLENISSLDKDTRIKSLEDLVIKLGYNPKDIMVGEELLKKKDANISALRKQLKLLTTKDAQAKELGEIEKKKEGMFRIVIKLNSQIRDMEIELEKILKEKEHAEQLDIVPLTAVPIALAITTGASASTSTTIIDLASELVRAMDGLTIQEQEISKPKYQLKTLSKHKLKIDIFYVAELQKTNQLNLKIEQSHSEFVMGQTLAQAREKIQIEIDEAIIEIWPSTQIIF